MDLNSTIVPKSDQMNAEDLISGPRTITITKVSANPGNPDQPVAISFEGDGGRPFLPCKTVRRVLVSAWGPDASTFVGRSLTIYRDPKVRFGGLEVGGIRISHMSHIERDMVLALAETRGKRAPHQIRRLVEQPKPTAPAADPTVVGQAKTAAKAGTEAFRAWWKDNAAHRASLTPMMPEFQDLCRQGDAILAEQAQAPFASDPLPADHDPDAIRAAAFAASDAAAAALSGDEAA